MRRALWACGNCEKLAEKVDIYVPVAGVSWKKSVHSTSSSARMKNLAAALLLLAARADTFSALSKTTYSEGGRQIFHACR